MNKKSYEKYKIIKILNNNVILAQNLTSNQQMVLVGKGLGFGHKTNKMVKLAPNKIQKSFVSYDENIKKEYYHLIKNLDHKVIGISEEIITLANKELGALNPHIHIALTDHLSFAFERLKMGMEVSNPFLEEIKILYSSEYEVSIKAAKMIKDKLNILISDSEVGFITMHLHSARQNKEITKTIRYTSLLKELVVLVEKELNIKFNRSDLSYIRLINHLRFSIERMEKDELTKNPLKTKIKKEFKETYQLAKKMGLHIKERLNIDVSEDEVAYIALHLNRLKNY